MQTTMQLVNEVQSHLQRTKDYIDECIVEIGKLLPKNNKYINLEKHNILTISWYNDPPIHRLYSIKYNSDYDWIDIIGKDDYNSYENVLDNETYASLETYNDILLALYREMSNGS